MPPFVLNCSIIRRWSRSSTDGRHQAGDVAAEAENFFYQAGADERICLVRHQKNGLDVAAAAGGS